MNTRRGLAIDMSTVDSLNEADPDTVAKGQGWRRKYGFVLRFPDGKNTYPALICTGYTRIMAISLCW